MSLDPISTPENKSPLGQRIALPGHFLEPVTLEAIRFIGSGYECRVRLSDGTPDEAILSLDEAAALAGQVITTQAAIHPADPEKLRLLVESARIRLAYAHDRQFAVSLSGIRTLPHQIEAVYMKMLPQPRLRFLLADDPGAGKTIMAGLLLKEMKLREAIERILRLCPAPLTIQWQDELLRWFGEPFEIIFSAVDQQQLVNPWQRATQVIASLDYAKQDDVRERVWQQRWDLVIIDEAHKCSAYTKRSSGRGDEVEKTRRYQLAERLAADADHLLLLTATPHHGDDDRFSHFVRLIDPDLFPEPTRVGERAGESSTPIC
jgi:superfamily II DNA or RNA helicase